MHPSLGHWASQSKKTPSSPQQARYARHARHAWHAWHARSQLVHGAYWAYSHRTQASQMQESQPFATHRRIQTSLGIGSSNQRVTHSPHQVLQRPGCKKHCCSDNKNKNWLHAVENHVLACCVCSRVLCFGCSSSCDRFAQITGGSISQEASRFSLENLKTKRDGMPWPQSSGRQPSSAEATPRWRDLQPMCVAKQRKKRGQVFHAPGPDERTLRPFKRTRTPYTLRFLAARPSELQSTVQLWAWPDPVLQHTNCLATCSYSSIEIGASKHLLAQIIERRTLLT